MDDIYEYDDFRRFVADWLSAEKGRSLRKLSKAVGIAPSTLSQVIKLDSAAPRKLPVRAFDALCAALELDEQEARYLVALIEHRQLRDPGERAAAWDRAVAVRRFQYGKGISRRQYEVMSEWHHGAIAELAHCRQFEADPAWVAKTLVPPISTETAKRSLELLTDIGLLVPDPVRGLRPASGLVIDTEWADSETRKAAARRAHRWTLERAIEVIDEMDSDQRLLISATIAISSDDLPKLRDRTIAALQEAMEVGTGGGDARDRLVQVNLQVFPLSVDPSP